MGPEVRRWTAKGRISNADFAVDEDCKSRSDGGERSDFKSGLCFAELITVVLTAAGIPVAANPTTLTDFPKSANARVFHCPHFKCGLSPPSGRVARLEASKKNFSKKTAPPAGGKNAYAPTGPGEGFGNSNIGGTMTESRRPLDISSALRYTKANEKKGGGHMKRYYIGGKQYVPEESTELCSYADVLEKSALYATDKGAFFIVREGFMNGTTARVVSREDAFGYMDAHADGIRTENYNRFFGEPERG